MNSTVPVFDAWVAGRLLKSMPISALSNSVIGIDAAYYLETIGKEPLLSALGGFPMGLESSVVREMTDLQAVGLRPHFVFNGLDHGTIDDPFGPSLASAKKNAIAFQTYEQEQAMEAIELFRASGIPCRVCPYFLDTY